MLMMFTMVRSKILWYGLEVERALTWVIGLHPDNDTVISLPDPLKSIYDHIKTTHKL